MAAECDRFRADYARVRAAVAQAVVGQDAVLDGVLVALLAGGHVLLEGVPGLGKTRLATSLAAALDVSLGRVQCTPDLMPADVTGTDVVSAGGADAGAAARNSRSARGRSSISSCWWTR